MSKILKENTLHTNERILSLLEDLNSTLDLYYEDSHDIESSNID